MAAANSRMHALAASPALDTETVSLFKKDRPRHIDRFISFFGDDRNDTDACGEALLESFGDEQRFER
jgi:hypothetical protein